MSLSSCLIDMSCNNPNKVFYVGFDEETHKNKIAFCGRKTDYVTLDATKGKYSQHTGTPPPGVDAYTQFDLVPCGQCLGCRMDRARSWATRLMLEKKYYPDDQCWFVTLTYDDDHLPEKNHIIDSVTGEYRLSTFHPLVKKDHKDFMKELRRLVKKRGKELDIDNGFDNKLRFFCSGEYGSKSFRPHFHYIIFGLQLFDLSFYKLNFEGDRLYNSAFIDAAWKHKGFCVISKVTFESANYVARYITKKHLGKDNGFYEKVGITPEFSCMSLKPGIGYSYFADHLDDLLLTDNVVLPSKTGGFLTGLPRYFDHIVADMDPLAFVDLKEKRAIRQQELHDTLLHNRPFLDEDDIFDAKERLLKANSIYLKKGEL